MYVCVCVWHKMTELEKQNGDLRRQLDSQLYESKLDVDRDNPDELSRAELARRYCKLSYSVLSDFISHDLSCVLSCLCFIALINICG